MILENNVLLMKMLNVIQIFGISSFLGYMILSVLLKLISRTSGNVVYVFYVLKFIIKTDKIYYGISSSILVTSSIILNTDYLKTGYKLTSLCLIIFTGIIWICFLVPIQNSQNKVITNQMHSTEIPSKFIELEKKWFFAGTIALFLTLTAIFLMV